MVCVCLMRQKRAVDDFEICGNANECAESLYCNVFAPSCIKSKVHELEAPYCFPALQNGN